MIQSPPVFRLPPEMRAEIVAHAREEAPRECCGVILGMAGELLELRPMANVYPGDDFYEIEPSALYRLIIETEARGTEIAAIYHSHPVSPAYPSPRDVEYAGWPEAVYLICSLQNPDEPVIRAFRIVDGEITELRIQA